MPVLVLAAVLIVAIEVFLIVTIAGLIGGLPTVGLLLVGCLAGSWLLRHEGRRAYGAVRAALAEGRAPDGGLHAVPYRMAGGALLMIPGFLTDLFGVLVLIPAVRPLARTVARRLRPRGVGYRAPLGVPFGAPGAGWSDPQREPFFEARVERDGTEGGGTTVVRGEVIETTETDAT